MESRYKALGHLTEVEKKDGRYVASRLYTFYGLQEIMKLISDVSSISEVEYAIGIGEAIINDLHENEIYEFTGRLNSREKLLVKSLHKFRGSMIIKYENIDYLIGIEKLHEKEDVYWVGISTEGKTEKDSQNNLNKLLLEIELY